MNDMSRFSTLGAPRQLPVPREQTQQLLDLRSAASAQIKPADLYTLADRLEAQAQRFPDQPFLIYGTDVYSYAQVDAQANRMAHVFYDKGLRPGDVCAIAMENRRSFSLLVWSGQAWGRGGVYQHPGQWQTAGACAADH